MRSIGMTENDFRRIYEGNWNCRTEGVDMSSLGSQTVTMRWDTSSMKEYLGDYFTSSKGEEKMSLFKVYATDGETIKKLELIAKSKRNAEIKAAMQLEIDPDEWDIFVENIGELSEK